MSEEFPKMHWRRRRLIEEGWNNGVNLKIFLKKDFFNWVKLMKEKNKVPTDIKARKIFFSKKLENFIKTNQSTAYRIYKTGLMDKRTEDNLYISLNKKITVKTIEDNFFTYIQNYFQNIVTNDNIDTILNHFDLHELRCPSKIIRLLFEYENKNGEINNKENFLDFRVKYNDYILSEFKSKVNNRKIKNLYLIRTEINSDNLLSKNILAVGEYNIYFLKEIKDRTNIFNDEKYGNFSFDNIKLDVIGGTTLYMLIENYNKENNTFYKEILDIIAKNWNDIIIQDSFEKIIIPEHIDFQNYFLNWCEKFYMNNEYEKFYQKQYPLIYKKFQEYENLYL